MLAFGLLTGIDEIKIICETVVGMVRRSKSQSPLIASEFKLGSVFRSFLVDYSLQLLIVFEAVNKPQELPEFLYHALSIHLQHFHSQYQEVALEMMSSEILWRNEFLPWQRDGHGMENRLLSFLGIHFEFIMNGILLATNNLVARYDSV